MSGDPTSTNDPKIAKRILEAQNRVRWRTIFYSVVASGLVSMMLVRVSEVKIYNGQVGRSRVNCQIVQDDFQYRVRELERRSDRVLGNREKHIQPLVFKGTAFAKFEQLIVADAFADRRRAQDLRARIQDCAEIFPKRSLFAFFE